MPYESQQGYVEEKDEKVTKSNIKGCGINSYFFRTRTRVDLIRSRNSKLNKFWNAIIRYEIVKIVGVKNRFGNRG